MVMHLANAFLDLATYDGSCVTDLALCGAQTLNVLNELNEYWELVLEITIFKNHWNN